MRILLSFIILIPYISILGLSQDTGLKDPKAKSILDKVSNTNKSFSTTYIEFDYHLINTPNGIDETQAGKIWMKYNKYKLDLPGLARYSMVRPSGPFLRRMMNAKSQIIRAKTKKKTLILLQY